VRQSAVGIQTSAPLNCPLDPEVPPLVGEPIPVPLEPVVKLIAVLTNSTASRPIARPR
jgi:hypothetical protein